MQILQQILYCIFQWATYNIDLPLSAVVSQTNGKAVFHCINFKPQVYTVDPQ